MPKVHTQEELFTAEEMVVVLAAIRLAISYAPRGDVESSRWLFALKSALTKLEGMLG